MLRERTSQLAYAEGQITGSPAYQQMLMLKGKVVALQEMLKDDEEEKENVINIASKKEKK